MFGEASRLLRIRSTRTLRIEEVICMSWKIGPAVGALLILLGLSVLAIPLCDYNSARSELTELKLSFSYNYHNDPYGLEEFDVSAGRLRVRYGTLFDSPLIGYDYSIDGDTTISVLELSTYRIDAQGSLKWFLEQDREANAVRPTFVFSGLSTSLSSASDRPSVSVLLGVGTGRFNDVTPLAKAVRIDEILYTDGSLTAHLADVDLLSLARAIDNITTYSSRADLLTVIEGEILFSSGVVTEDGLDATDLAAIEGVLDDDRLTRYCGGDVRLGLEYELVDPSHGPNDLLATLAANYAFTTTPNSQFLISSAISGSHNIWQANRIALNASYNFLARETYSFAVSYSYLREQFLSLEGAIGDPTSSHNVAANLNITPTANTLVTVSLQLCHETHFTEWCSDITLSLGLDLF